jgi:PAT family beta-lactamase induction signal transducer AmpG
MFLLLGATKVAARFGAVSVDSPDKTGFYTGFSLAYAVAGVLTLFVMGWNKFTMPVLEQDQPVKHTRFAIAEVARDYFTQRSVFWVVMLIIFYRFGEGFLIMKQPFYLDPLDAGGLAADASALPYYTILTDTPWNIAGGVLGGYLIKWFGLRKTFVPLALLMSLPNLFYVFLAVVQPMAHVMILGERMNLWLLLASSLESLGYGMSFSALFYYMHIMATESGRNKTSILAMSLVIMNFGWFLPGMLSGVVQAYVGYVGTFIISSTVGLVVLLLIPHLPMPSVESTFINKKG